MEIHLKDVTKVYRRGAKALDGVTLDIQSGVFGLLGPNGAGKSTMMKMIATLVVPTSGHISVDNYTLPAQQNEVRHMLGYLPQEYGLFNNLTAYELMDYIALMKGIGNDKQRRNDINRLLDWVGLNDAIHHRVGSFSGGMKQRLAIAQALLGSPRLLILDEPTAGLDPEERLRFRNLINRISVDRIVILSTHIVSDVAAGCQRLAVLNHLEGELDALKRCADGITWEAQVDPSIDTEHLPGAVMVSSQRRDGSLYLRFLAKEPSISGAVPASPDLEDGYMALISGMRAGAAS